MPEPLIDYTIQGLINEDKVYDTKDKLMEEDITISNLELIHGKKTHILEQYGTL